MRAESCVVVTGASTGIGEATARLLTGAGFFVFGSVRRQEDASRLQQALGGNFAPLFFDVADGAAIEAAAREVDASLAGRTLAGLVNNAGAAFPGPLLYQPVGEFSRQIEINLIGQLRVIQAFAPLLGAGARREGEPGRIINMSSVAGSFASPFLGAYAASKHAFEGLSASLRRELMIYGVDVIVIAPGVIRTPIWDKAEEAKLDRYDATAYGPSMRRMQKRALEEGRKGPPAELVAKAVLRALTLKHPPARIPVVRNYLLDWILPRSVPARIVDWLIARELGFLAPRLSQQGGADERRL
jgi:NAD(P)-dependent dehydrogenase (short-subunit alcohol dehydrogenase family)